MSAAGARSPSANQSLGLGIETSCDESSVAVVQNGGQCLANVIYSQLEEHRPFRGVVPEIASRAHLEKLNDCLERALTQSGIGLEAIDFIAVTIQPGLVGSLMIGGQLAKALALVTQKPLIAVDHLEAHLYAPVLEQWTPEYPFLGLLLSGGNSAIFLVHGLNQMELIADTLDDACGEAFDKISSILGLPYPGGPHIEAAAAEFDDGPTNLRWTVETSLFTRLLRNQPGDQIHFSFSGLKTAALRAHQQGLPAGRICRDFQETAFHLVDRNIQRAVQKTGLRRLVASGGVLANQRLRRRLEELAGRLGLDLVYPRSRALCTDNAAMIAALGDRLYRADLARATLDFSVSSQRDLLPFAPAVAFSGR